jgi:esterase/lipase superfamily enzyme
VQFIDPSTPKDEFGWYSPALGMQMPIVRYGNWGRALLLFPTAQSDLYDCERFFLIKAIEHLIHDRRISVFCINTINDVSWMKRDVPVPEKGRRQRLFSMYVEEEVVPHIRRVLGQPDARLGAAGASFGAFHATNAVFRRPDMFEALIAMSGFMELGEYYLQGYSDENIYYNNPGWYVPRLPEGHALDLLRHHSQLHILTGQGAYEMPEASRRFSEKLAAKGIPHNLDVWGWDVNHDWVWWRRMLPIVLGERLHGW